MSTSELLKLFTTTPDKILRELTIIDTIFRAQYFKYETTFPFPYLLDKNGHSAIEGRYIISIYLLSDLELFSVQVYKKELTDRFENTTNFYLSRNQMLEIREKAIQIEDFYNKYLTRGNTIVDEFAAKNSSLESLEQFQERPDFHESHRSTATVSNYYLMGIYFGVDHHSQNRFVGNRDKYTYCYLSDNLQLASFCSVLIDFTDKFEFKQQVADKSTRKKTL